MLDVCFCVCVNACAAEMEDLRAKRGVLTQLSDYTRLVVNMFVCMVLMKMIYIKE